ncbi:aldehyde dehydrogenase family protein [Dongia sp.]|uniref:aldehyde dehydrogenase family protein n=1 Tax=Dongia sp. TaxID=1977262 RepID=UPI0035B245A0
MGGLAHAEVENLNAAMAATRKDFAAWRRVWTLERPRILRCAADLLRERTFYIAD